MATRETNEAGATSEAGVGDIGGTGIEHDVGAGDGEFGQTGVSANTDAPTEFIDWLNTTLPDETTEFGAVLLEAFGSDPGRAGDLWEEVLSAIDDSPGEVPQELRAMAGTNPANGGVAEEEDATGPLPARSAGPLLHCAWHRLDGSYPTPAMAGRGRVRLTDAAGVA